MSCEQVNSGSTRVRPALLGACENGTSELSQVLSNSITSHDFIASRGKNHHHPERSTFDAYETNCLRSIHCQASRTDECQHSSRTASTPALPCTTESKKLGSCLRRLQLHSISQGGRTPETSLVDEDDQGCERSCYQTQTSRQGHLHRCFPHGIGGQCTINIRLGGLWTDAETNLHIICLELLAAWYAVQAFTLMKRDLHILLWIDNQSAVAYINHKGGNHSTQLAQLAIQFWSWAVQKGITLEARHIAGRKNVQADRMSRTIQDRSDWKLRTALFHQLNILWGPLEIDLFATRISTQLPRFFSWKPEPLVEAIDAFLQVWSTVRGYANPPWCLLTRCLRKAARDLSRVHTRAESGSNRVHTTISCQADPDRIPIESGLANPPREVDSIRIRPRSGLSRLIT